MSDPIDFYFDFSSPYGYLASLRIDDIAARHGRAVNWRPMLLGAVFKKFGGAPLSEVPLKSDYFLRDMPRAARLMGAPFKWPDPFPFASIAACRAIYWQTDMDPEAGRALARALYHTAFGEGGDIATAKSVVEVAAKVGIDRAAAGAALQDAAVKDRLRQEVEAAMERGVFGSPYVVVDGEPFWGHDRLDQVDRWLETGGW